jgi:hypothetical protein
MTKRTSTVIGRRAHGTRHVLVPAHGCRLPLAILLRQCRLFALSDGTVIATGRRQSEASTGKRRGVHAHASADLFCARDWHPGDHPPSRTSSHVAESRMWPRGVSVTAPTARAGRKIRVSRNVCQVNDSVSAYN